MRNQKISSSQNHAYSVYSRDENKTNLFNKLQSLQAHLKTTIEESKQKYNSRLFDKPLDSKPSLKSCWSVV